ncbi:membrane protease subunit [Waddlia chondrophila]|uniref:Putative membrane protease subunit n=1 Tax=Waddlia chondrophila (strain ATCC VR-1470 / WSU 86-1044) TaxID=716544 RepID=D6YV75_WADCW|nr:membrane protease subunit [Waddlia chondrophila]ADI38036.1 putative membrane protease subunit [Waddlia chondrophila WSU 86-1044]
MDLDKKYEEREKERQLQKIIEKRKSFKTVAYILTLLFIGFAFLLGFLPIYSVWAERLSGEAELARAESNRQIRILEARAEQEAAKSLAEAEVIRAEGVAKANKIIGDSLENNEGYLRYLWIQGLQTNQQQVVYIPTEANLPILEANRINKNN